MYLQKYIQRLYTYLTTKEHIYKYKNVNSLDQLIMQRTRAINISAVLNKCGFNPITVRDSLSIWYFNNLLLWRNNGESWS